MKKKTVLVFVFDGMADWGPSYAMVGIKKSNAYQIKTLAINKSPIVTLGGMSLCPDLDFRPQTDLDDLDSSNTAMLILPGGKAWEGTGNQDIAALVYHCIENQIRISAIGEATLFLAHLGLLDEVPNTSPDREIITAIGNAPMEFAQDIFQSLDILENEALKEWFSGFQNKMVDF